MNTLSVFGMKWNEPSLRSDLTALMDTYAVQVKGDLTGIPNLIMIRAANPGPLSRLADDVLKEVKYELEGDDEAANNLLAEMEFINMQLFRAAYKTKIDELKVKV
jgi:hypothetical protein